MIYAANLSMLLLLADGVFTSQTGFTERGELQVVDLDLYIDCGHKDSMNNVIGPMKIFRYMDMGKLGFVACLNVIYG